MQKQISGFISLSVYLDTPLDVALARRTLRDCKDKPSDVILGWMEWYLKNRHLFALSNDFQKNDAELVIDGCLSTDAICDLILARARML